MVAQNSGDEVEFTSLGDEEFMEQCLPAVRGTRDNNGWIIYKYISGSVKFRTVYKDLGTRTITIGSIMNYLKKNNYFFTMK